VGTIGMGIEMIYLNGKWAKIVEEKCEQKKQSLSSDTFKCQNCGNIQNSWEYSSGKTGCCDNCGCVSCDRIEENSPKVEDIPSLSTDEMIGVLKNLYPDKKVQKNLSDLEISIMDLKNKNNL
jgi:transcription initiation factor TFIIIB Brf1 subunit/transcription initiation factor TFIIB